MSGEASIGSFDVSDLNDGWHISAWSADGDEISLEEGDEIRLPCRPDLPLGTDMLLTNTLPEGIKDGMQLSFRTAMEDVEISIAGKLRSSYISEELPNKDYYLPSAYVVVELYDDDAGQEIEIHVKNKSTPVLNGVTLGYGANVWSPVLHHYLIQVFFAVDTIILGCLTAILCFLIRKKVESSPILFLGLLIMVVGIWVLSESNLRQLVFHRPSLSTYFSFLSLESMAALACMYFDRVQKKRYHLTYLIVESCILGQLLVNLSLHFCRTVNLYESLVFSHFWSGVAIIAALTCLFRDMKSHKIEEYRMVAIGFLLFMAMCLIELVQFYLNRFHQFGFYITLGLLVLLAATIVQTVTDELKAMRRREREQKEMALNAIETISNTVDARDKYTGGHSARVGKYSGILAEAVADEYGFTKEDVDRIRYIGLVHDIGKVGIPDAILNKPGKLDDEEFALMKQHAVIGYELLGTLKNSVDGLLDGIRHHHERYDGKGYPDGLAGEEIPLVARMICLCDCYDAMTTNRVYRPRLEMEKVRSEFVRCKGSQFDPHLADIFIRLMDEGKLDVD